MKSLLLLFFLAAMPAFAQTADDDFWVQRTVGAATVISAQLDYAGKITAMAIRKNQPGQMMLFTTPNLDLMPSSPASTARVKTARAQAAGMIGAAWMRYCGEVNAACIDTNQAPRIKETDPKEIYEKIVGTP